jgi:hypothetical protein
MALIGKSLKTADLDDEKDIHLEVISQQVRIHLV